MTAISIKKGVTPCYQCVEGAKEQSFPVCTIRQKPEKTIHCIVWAKALFEGLFGPKENASQNMLEDIIEDLEKHQGDKAFAKILIDKLFGQEPTSLKETLNTRSFSSECDPDEKKENLEFIDKIKPVFYKEGVEMAEESSEDRG